MMDTRDYPVVEAPVVETPDFLLAALDRVS
jgi:hypothetical protein